MSSKICIVAASPRLNSGFGVVAINIAKGLKKLGYDVSYIGLQTAHGLEFYNGIDILPAQSFHLDDITNTMLIINKIKPDIVLAIIQMDADFNDFAKIFPKTICYTPVEGRDIPQKMANDLLSIKMNKGEVVAQCNYGKQEMELALGGLTVPVIYHGYDPDIYREFNKDDGLLYCWFGTEVGKSSISPETLCKQGCWHCNNTILKDVNCPYSIKEQITVLKFVEEDKKWGEYNIGITELGGLTKGKFVLGCVSQNLGVRKRLERLLKAYSLFIGSSRQLRDRTVMHIHCMPIAINGLDLTKVVRELGLNGNVIFSYGTYRSSGWSDKAMAILYNTFDVNVSASSSEGFGLATLESMACGVPNIGPECSSFIELIGNDKDIYANRGLLATLGEWQMIENGSLRFLVNEGHLAEAMKRIYLDDKLRTKLGKNAKEWAKQYNWTNICAQWDKLLKGMK